MKTLVFLFSFLLCFLFSDICPVEMPSAQAQWQPDVRLTNNTATSYTSNNNGRCIAASGDTLHVTWQDTRDGNMEIYYKRSFDGGVSWNADVRMTNNPSESWRPSVAVLGGIVHIAWYDLRDGNYEIYYKRSPDGGTTWTADIRLTNDPGQTGYPSIFPSGSVIHVVFGDTRDAGVREIYYKRSTDEGITWGPDVRLTNDPAESGRATVSASGSLVHLLWHDNRDGNFEVYYKRSTDGGLSWGTETRLSNTSTASEYPSMSSLDSFVHAFWKDGSSAQNIFYRRSTDDGLSWQPDTQLTNNTSTTTIFPSIALSNYAVHLVWQDSRDGNKEIYYKKSLNEGVSWGADIRLTNNSFSSESPFIAVSGPALHTVWQDNRDGNYEIYYKRDPTGNPIGINIINTEIPKEFSLSQNYPNPFNPKTIINFQLPIFPEGTHSSNYVELIVYDVLGREVAVLVNEELKPGTYEVDWDASNFPSGVYYYRLTVSDYSETRKMVLLK